LQVRFGAVGIGEILLTYEERSMKMKGLKTVLATTVVFGAMTLSAYGAEVKSPAELLQEGIYAEETEGNLDTAIEKYEQVLDSKRAYLRTAAQATFRIGMCYLKKGEKDTAGKYFQEVVDKYPKQRSVVALAQAELEKLGAVSGGTDSVIRKVYLPDVDAKGEFLDLASGEVMAPVEVNGEPNYLLELGKGDLAWDGWVICLRDATAKIWKDGEYVDMEIVSKHNHGTVYRREEIPCKLLITKANGEKYEVTVVSEVGEGVNLEYRSLGTVGEGAVILKDSFEEGTDAPYGWEKGQAVPGVSYIWDRRQGSDGKSSLGFEKTVQRYFPIAQWTRKVEYSGDAKELEIKAQVKAEKVTKAIIDALFLDKGSEWIKHEWVSYIGQKQESDPLADHDWKEYSGKVSIPEGTKYIVFGLQMYGPGKVWFDEFEATLIGGEAVTRTVVRPADKLKSDNLSAEAWMLWKQQKFAEAEAKFREAAELDSKNENAWQGLGWAQFNQGKNLNAKESFEKCVALNPKNSAALNGLGWIASAKGDKDEAIKWWEKAVEAQPGATASLSGLTQVYMERGEYEKAAKYYRMWLAAEPGNEDAKEGLAKAERAASRQREAFKKAVPAAEHWLALVDEGKYGESWQAAAGFFKKMVTKEQWETAVGMARKPFGKLISRQVSSTAYTTTAPGAPDGEYVIITCNASYENKKDAIETVTPMLDSDGKWRVSGYFVK
jgi:tetratricopeptide (TPR) repeat protein